MIIKQRSDLKNGEYYDIYVSVKGVKKRCRKTTKENINVGYIPLCELTDKIIAELKVVAIEAVKNKMKSVENQTLFFAVTTIERENGFTTTKYELYDKRNKKFVLTH